MDLKINNIIRIPTSLDSKFFEYWLKFLGPFHSFTDRELQVATAILKHRYELSKVIKEDSILDKVVLGEDGRKKIMKECEISLSHLQVIMGKLKKRQFLIDGRVNPRFVPNITEEKGAFKLLLYFDLQ